MITLSDTLLHNAIGDVLSSLLGQALDEQADSTAVASLTASVTISGEFDGLLAVRCSEQTARRLASAMFDDDPDVIELSDVADAMGEVANQVGGVVKTLVPGPSQLGLPLVVSGSGITSGDLPFLSSAALDRDEGRVQVFLFGRPVDA